MKRDTKVRILFYREREGYDGNPFHKEAYADFSPPIPSKGDLVSIAAQAFEVVEVCYWYRRKQIDIGISLKQAIIFPDSEELDDLVEEFEDLDEEEGIPDTVVDEDEEPKEVLSDEAKVAVQYLSELHKEYQEHKGGSNDSSSGSDT